MNKTHLMNVIAAEIDRQYEVEERPDYLDYKNPNVYGMGDMHSFRLDDLADAVIAACQNVALHESMHEATATYAAFDIAEADNEIEILVWKPERDGKRKG